MKKHYYLPLLLLLGSCASSLNYVGNSYTPTNQVDVYVDESAIRKAYEIVGKGYVRNGNLANPERIQKKAIRKAQQKGADAVLLKDYFVPAVTGIQTTNHRDSSGRTITTNQNAVIPVAASTEIIVLFLKYK
jgi:hypothetical protein